MAEKSILKSSYAGCYDKLSPFWSMLVESKDIDGERVVILQLKVETLEWIRKNLRHMSIPGQAEHLFSWPKQLIFPCFKIL